MRIICAEFYDIISNIITTPGRISPWSETLRRHGKSNLLRRAKSSPSHKSVACIIGIVEPPNPNFGAAAGPRDKSTQIDRRWIASKGLERLVTNRVSIEFDKNRNDEAEIGFGVTNKSCLHA